VKYKGFFFKGGGATDGGADKNTDPLGNVRAKRQRRVVHRHLGCGESVNSEFVLAANLFFVDKLQRIKILDFARDAGGVSGCVKPGNRADAGLSRHGVRPGFRGGVAQRSHGAEACYHNTPFH
jgi:hypothetical protein